MNRMAEISGRAALALVLLLLQCASSSAQPDANNVAKANCWKTVGAVQYNYNASSPLPDGARQLACYFDNNESCYSFVPQDAPESVEYGCGRIDVDDLPESCLEARNRIPRNACWDKAFHNGAKGKLCCCMGDLCNAPQNVEEILPTTTPTPATTEKPVPHPSEIYGHAVGKGSGPVTSTSNSTALQKSQEEEEDGKWWHIPLLLFVIFTLFMIFLFIVVLIFIIARIQTYRKHQSELSKFVDQRLKEYAQQLSMENRELTLKTFRALVEEHHEAKKKARREAMEQNRESQSQQSQSAEPSQPSSKVEESSASPSSSIFNLFPKNPCCSTSGRKRTLSAEDKASAEKLPRVENV